MEKRTKHIASVSLGVMAAGFAGSFALPAGAAWGAVLQSGFEAGLVGGLADWFAVTALFRHPLGIPIPHTALLPRNRERVTNALVNAVENELLSKQSIADKLGGVRLTAALLDTLERSVPQGQLAAWCAAGLQQAVRHAPLDLLVPFAAEQAKEALRELDIAPLLQKLGEQVLARRLDEQALDALLEKAEEWLAKQETRDSLGRIAMGAVAQLELGGFMQFAVNAFIGYLSEDKLGSMIQNFGLGYIYDLRFPGHPRRDEALAFVRRQIAELSRSQRLIAQLEEWKAEQLDSLDLTAPLGKLLSRLQERLLAALADSGFAERTLQPMLERLLAGLRSNEELQHKADGWMREQLVRLVEANHGKIGQLVRDNIRKLDDAQLIEMLEDKVGKDLQWIRVNGAVCGFLIGIVLGLVKLLA
ncbi:hypothetical protein SD70_16590 [Gordoniibacillus kamchatkensis]|uniref:DUF445 domain-containing protein n=1 Tax=Gordoniibacillus kamchatkensis TaxID=1590651 RepID=A0ABR5AGB3_9BACL|nr:DUF445 domain-containing protein [Paenibacillus sp. VKM B-2647]KIL39995.1 hypothetical protein SD70_16590 [Paenibacillus sp. VKM B-2647]